MSRRDGSPLKVDASRRDRPLPAGSEFLSNAVKILLVGLAYYVAARLSLRLALIEKNVTPLWPPTGIALVAFVLLGRSVWPGVALAALLVNASISANPVAAAMTAVGNTLAPLVAAELLRMVGFRKELDRVRDAIAIVFPAALGATLISASIGSWALVIFHEIPARRFASAWFVWWTGDAMGVLVVAPVLLSLIQLRQREKTTWARRVEAVGLLLVLGVLTIVVTRTHLRMWFLLIPLLGWAAWRFQLRGAAPAALLIASVATWAVAHDWGAFAEYSLLEKMVVLQAFNATVAFTSLVFAALVTERLRARKALEQAAQDLEERVRLRTAELSAANERLTREIAERKAAVRSLRERERQLAEAQQTARLGSWEWLIDEDRVTWSDEMYRIHGYHPQEFPMTFEKAVALIVREDLPRIQENLGAALGARKTRGLPPTEYRIVRMDGDERALVGRSRLIVGPDGKPQRMIGTVQDVTEDKRAEREHRIAETLQRSLLPDQLPSIPGVGVAVRYVPATTGMSIGGDWYDVVPLPNGHLGVAIGDVAGHGLRAAATMGQLRMTLRAYALEEPSPLLVMRRVRELVQRLIPSEMATLLYMVLDLDSGSITFSNAGHLPPLLIDGDGTASYLEHGLAPPLGTAPHPEYDVEARAEIASGSTLLLFTDGLVERRGVSVRDGLERLRAEVTVAGSDLDQLCDHVIASLLDGGASDDVALLAIRPVRFAGNPLHVRLPADPIVLASLRHTLRRWLREADADPREVYEILVACGEACANAIEHPHGAGAGALIVEAARRGDEVDITVRDTGTWRDSPPPHGGHGLNLMRQLMDTVDVDRQPSGTVVRMRRRLGEEAVR